MSDALPMVEEHLAVGEGWALSRGSDALTGTPRLLVTLPEADLLEVRQGLAVAGSLSGRHLAEVVDVVSLADRAAVVVLAAPGGPSLAELRRRGPLAAAQVVTLVAPLAVALGEMDARGLTVAVTPETVWVAVDGCPVLVPVLGRPGDAAGGVTTLARLARELLDPASRHATAVAAALDSAARGELDAAALSSAMLRAAPAQPINAPSPAAAAATGRRRAGGRRARRAAVRIRPLQSRGARSAVAIVVVVAAAVGLGALSGRGGSSGVVLAAPPVVPSTTPTPPSWMSLMAQLERSRARAFATGDAGLLAQAYAPGSPTGAADQRLLAGLVDRGQRAAGLQAFVQSVAVLAQSDARVTIRVTDELTAYDVVGRSGRVVRNGHGRPARQWRVVLVRTGSGWRLWSVRPD